MKYLIVVALMVFGTNSFAQHFSRKDLIGSWREVKTRDSGYIEFADTVHGYLKFQDFLFRFLYKVDFSKEPVSLITGSVDTISNLEHIMNSTVKFFNKDSIEITTYLNESDSSSKLKRIFVKQRQVTAQ